MEWNTEAIYTLHIKASDMTLYGTDIGKKKNNMMSDAGHMQWLIINIKIVVPE